MTQFCNVPATPYFRDSYAVVARGEPCPFVRAVGCGPTATHTAAAIVEAVAARVCESAITVTGTPENKALMGGVVFSVPGRAYVVCGGDSTIFLDLTRPREPVSGLSVGDLAFRLVESARGLGATRTQWALLSDEGHVRDLATLQEVKNDRHAISLCHHAQTLARSWPQVSVGLSLPRLSLTHVPTGELVGLIVDYGDITHTITSCGPEPVPDDSV